MPNQLTHAAAKSLAVSTVLPTDTRRGSNDAAARLGDMVVSPMLQDYLSVADYRCLAATNKTLRQIITTNMGFAGSIEKSTRHDAAVLRLQELPPLANLRRSWLRASPWQDMPVRQYSVLTSNGRHVCSVHQAAPPHKGQQRVCFWDAALGQQSSCSWMLPGQCLGVNWQAQPQAYMLAAQHNVWRCHALTDGRVLQTLPLPAAAQNFSLAPNGRVAYATLNTQSWLFHTADPTTLHGEACGAQDQIAQAWLHDGRWLLLGDPTGCRLFCSTTMQCLGQFAWQHPHQERLYPCALDVRLASAVLTPETWQIALLCIGPPTFTPRWEENMTLYVYQAHSPTTALLAAPVTWQTPLYKKRILKTHPYQNYQLQSYASNSWLLLDEENLSCTQSFQNLDKLERYVANRHELTLLRTYTAYPRTLEVYEGVSLLTFQTDGTCRSGLPAQFVQQNGLLVGWHASSPFILQNRYTRLPVRAAACSNAELELRFIDVQTGELIGCDNCTADWYQSREHIHPRDVKVFWSAQSDSCVVWRSRSGGSEKIKDILRYYQRQGRLTFRSA